MVFQPRFADKRTFIKDLKGYHIALKIDQLMVELSEVQVYCQLIEVISTPILDPKNVVMVPNCDEIIMKTYYF